MERLARAMVQTGPETFAEQRFAVPDPGEDGAVIRVEACGICGTDVETFRGTIPLRYPVVPGHEAVGIVERIGPIAARRWGVDVGDRVVVPAELACGSCIGCSRGGACLASPGTHGFVPTSVEPSLWGGFAEVMYLSPSSRPIRMDRTIDLSLAALFNPLGAGFAWAVDAPDLQPGQSIAILGPGQRGLASVLAAASIGASQIIVSGFGGRDSDKLALATRFGADLTIDAESTDVVSTILEATDGHGVDVVVDTTPHATESVHDALGSTRAGGTIVLAGLKGRTLDEFPVDEVAMRRLTLRGVRAVDHAGFRRAVDLIERAPDGLGSMQTHRFALVDAAEAVETLASGVGIAISLRPNG